MKIKFIVHVLIFVINFCYCKSKTYENFTLYNVVPLERYQLNFLQNLEKQKYLNVMFWTRPYKMFHDIQILVDPVDLDMFKERLKHFRINGLVLTENVQQ